MNKYTSCTDEGNANLTQLSSSGMRVTYLPEEILETLSKLNQMQMFWWHNESKYPLRVKCFMCVSEGEM